MFPGDTCFPSVARRALGRAVFGFGQASRKFYSRADGPKEPPGTAEAGFRTGLSLQGRVERCSDCYRREAVSLVALHGGMQAIFLELMHVMFRLFEALADEDTFAEIVDLLHMEFSLGA